MSYYFILVEFEDNEGNTKEYSNVFEVSSYNSPLEVWNSIVKTVKEEQGDNYFIIKDFKKL